MTTLVGQLQAIKVNVQSSNCLHKNRIFVHFFHVVVHSYNVRKYLVVEQLLQCFFLFSGKTCAVS